MNNLPTKLLIGSDIYGPKEIIIDYQYKITILNNYNQFELNISIIQ